MQGEFSVDVPSALEVIDLHCEKPIKGTRSLSDLLARIQPDSVIAFGMHTGIAAAISKTRFGWRIPLVVRNENNLKIEWRQSKPLNRLIGPPLSRWAARKSIVVTVSRSLRRPTAAYLKLEEHTVFAIRNPVFDEFSTTGNSKAELHPWLDGSNAPTFVAMGRLEHQKGFDTLLKAFSLVRGSSNAKLIIFGNGSLREKLTLLINKLGLQDSVDLPGYTANPISQMAAATAFVLSSRFEGFGLVIVEALASGTRVVSTDCDYGPSELLEGGKYGKLVPVGDESALSVAMNLAICDEWPYEKPTRQWLDQFSAIEAAKQHLALLN